MEDIVMGVAQRRRRAAAAAGERLVVWCGEERGEAEVRRRRGGEFARARLDGKRRRGRKKMLLLWVCYAMLRSVSRE